ncbi:MAG: hypothetical protein MJ225_04230 [Bacilli bacterium]|nr:hypothetical protein [Bacilli bacterium]
MRLKRLVLLLIPTLLPLSGCGSSPTPIKPNDPGLIGNKFIYNGRFDSFEFDPDTDPEAFMSGLMDFYDGGATEFRLDVARVLTTYSTSPTTTKKTPDGYTYFGNESTKQTIKYNDKDVTAYKVNNFENGQLCLYGLDPEYKNVYHFYSEEDDNKYGIANIIDRYMLGSPLHLTVSDDGFTYKDNQITVPFKVNLSYHDEAVDIDLTAYTTFYLGNGQSEDVEVIKQPTDIHVNYPSGPDKLKMSVTVNHPEKVVSYSWYIGAFSAFGEATSFSEINSDFSHSKDLTLMCVGCAQSKIPVKCLIKTEHREFFSGIGVIYVDNSNEYVPVIYLLDYPIMAGETLDLSTTPYGTGKIIYDSNETDITFDNVEFNNKNMNSNLESVGLKLQNWANPHEEFNFNFVGKNVWYNQYWEEDNHQGGLGFFIHFAGASKHPVVNFKGPGDITFIGGSRAISGTNIKVHVYTNINVLGLPNRLTGGIYADDITIESTGSVTGVLGNAILCALSDKPGCGGVVLKKGARVDATINAGNVSVDETQMFGIRALFLVQMTDAFVNIDIVVDYAYFLSLQQSLMPIEGIYSDLGAIEITNSIVNVDIRCKNLPDTSIIMIANSVSAMGGSAITIKNSTVNAVVDSYAFINVRGIDTGCFEAINSVVNVYAKGMRTVVGILSNYKKDHSVSGAIYIENSKVDVYAEAYTYEMDGFGKPYYMDSGITGVTFEFVLDSNSYIHVKTNRASCLLSIFDHVSSQVVPVKDYKPTQILLSDYKVDCSTYEINCNSYKGYSPNEEPKEFFVEYEAMYIPEEGAAAYTHYLTEILITAK